MLDASEVDPDLEKNGDAEPDNDTEPELGWPEQMNQTRALKACVGFGAANDLEQDTADDEPSLGSPLGALHDQRHWSAGNMSDLEDQHDGRESEDFL